MPIPTTEQWLTRFPAIERMDCGSSVKFCRIAEGAADVYPRLGRTSEWDIAAGDAVLSAAGGIVLTPEGTAASLRAGRAQSEGAGFRRLVRPR